MRYFCVAGVALITTACAPAPPAEDLPPPRPYIGKCAVEAAQVLIGKEATSETGAQALTLSGASRLRWGPPDSAFTMDYREDRVNVLYDREMMITKVTCG